MSIVFVIMGALGSDKAPILNLACKLLDGLKLAVPYTTRTPRIADQQNFGGRASEFFFTSREAFERMIENDEFLECASAFDNYYGTPSRYLQEARENGNDLMIQLDPGGVETIKQKVPDAASILILPGKLAEDSGTSGSSIHSRPHSLAQRTSSRLRMPDHDKYDKVIITVGIEQSANELIAFIRSERLRRS